MNHVMRLKKLDQYNPSFLPFEKLKAYDCFLLGTL